MNHLPRVGEAHSITATVRDNDRAGGFVRFVACPVALKLQEQLYQAREAGAGLLETAKRKVVAGWRESPTRVGNHGNVEAVFKGGERREADASLGEESRDDQALSLGSNNRIPDGVIFPDLFLSIAFTEGRASCNPGRKGPLYTRDAEVDAMTGILKAAPVRANATALLSTTCTGMDSMPSPSPA